MTSTILNQQISYKPFHPDLVNLINSVQELNFILRNQGCRGCSLGSQPDFIAPVVYRGNIHSGRLMVGEAPGKTEDIQGLPFTGPAGQKNDEIFAAVDWNSNKDWLISNVIFCRPVAPEGTGKQNLTPTASQRKTCKPYILRLIELVQPYLILLSGSIAAKTILPVHTQGKSMEELAGKVYYHQQFPNITFFIMYHPASLLHSQKKGLEEYNRLRKIFWEHINILKQVDQELRGE